MQDEEIENSQCFMGDIANKIGKTEYTGPDAQFIARGESMVFRVGDRALKIYTFGEHEQVLSYVKLTHLAKKELDGRSVKLGDTEFTMVVNPVDYYFQRTSDEVVCTVSKFVSGPDLHRVVQGESTDSSFNNLLAGTGLNIDYIWKELKIISEETNKKLQLPAIGGVWISPCNVRIIKDDEGTNVLMVTDISNTVGQTPKLTTSPFST